MNTALRLFELFKYVHIDISWPQKKYASKFSLPFALLLKLNSSLLNRNFLIEFLNPSADILKSKHS